MLGSGGLSSAGGPTKNAATAIAMIKIVDDNQSRQRQVRPKWLAAFLEHLFVFRAISCRVYWLACNGRLRNPVAKNQPEMEPDKCKHHCGQNENMDRKEATKGCSADGITAKDESRHPVADNGNAPCLLSRDHD